MISKTHSEVPMAWQIFKLFTNMQYRGETIKAHAHQLSIFLATFDGMMKTNAFVCYLCPTQGWSLSEYPWAWGFTTYSASTDM